MLISETTMQKWNSKNKFYYVQKGYIFTKMGDSFEVKVKDLTEGSKAIVQVKCDFCGNDVNKTYQTLLKHDNVPTSSQQIMLYDILVELYGNCKLNYPCGNNFLDCVIEYNGIKIDIEYDGWYWHQNKQRDRRRDEFVKSQGYKIFRIVGSHKIPDTKIIQESIEELISTDKTFIRINIV